MSTCKLQGRYLVVWLACSLLMQLSSVHCDASSRLRHIIKANPRGALACLKDETIVTSDNNSGQSPKCVKCGKNGQYACDGRRCNAKLQVLSSAGSQPCCFPDGSFKIKTDKRTASGKKTNLDKGTPGATISVTKDVGCGWPGWTCCAGKTCELEGICSGSTCLFPPP